MTHSNGFYGPLWHDNPDWLLADTMGLHSDANQSKNTESRALTHFEQQQSPVLCFTDDFTLVNASFQNFNADVTSITNQCQNYACSLEDLDDLLEVMKNNCETLPSSDSHSAVDIENDLSETESPWGTMSVEEMIICYDNDNEVSALTSSAESSKPTCKDVAPKQDATPGKGQIGRPKKYAEKNGAKNAASRKYNAKIKKIQVDKIKKIIDLTNDKEAIIGELIEFFEEHKHLLSPFKKRWLKKVFPEIFDSRGNNVIL